MDLFGKAKEVSKTVKEKKDKLEDKALNKIAGTNIETRRISCDELIDMVDKIFVKKAVNEKELDEIRKTCSDGALSTFTSMGGIIKNLDSKDGKYRLVFQTSDKSSIASTVKGSYVFIKDLETEIVYQLDNNHDRKKFMKAVKTMVNDRKKSLNIAVSETEEAEDVETEADINMDQQPDAVINETAENVESNEQASSTVFCTNCGQKIPTGVKFCPHCGQKNILAD